MQHSLRYFRHSGLVIYKSKLPAPSVLMPCDCYILQSPTKEQLKLVLFETVQRSHQSKLSLLVPLLRSSIYFCLCIPRVLFVPLALSPPWALQECRAYGTFSSSTTHQATANPFGGHTTQAWVSPKGAILLHSPGRKPWVNCFHTFIEPQRGGTFPIKK